MDSRSSDSYNVFSSTDDVTLTSKNEKLDDMNLDAGESYTHTIDLTTVDTSKVIVVKFNVTQATAVNGGLADNAVLSINGNRTLRVTTGGAMHIWDEKAGTQAEGSVQWSGHTSAQDVVVTIDIANNSVNFVYNNRNITLTSLDLSGTSIDLKFGGTNTPDLVLKNISISYYEWQ